MKEIVEVTKKHYVQFTLIHFCELLWYQRRKLLGGQTISVDKVIFFQGKCKFNSHASVMLKNSCFSGQFIAIMFMSIKTGTINVGQKKKISTVK